MSKIGYIRVSSLDQNTERQEVALKELKIDKVFTGLASEFPKIFTKVGISLA